MNHPKIIGITGGSGSGKTFFLKKLLATIADHSVSVFSLDNYYLPIEKQEKDSNGIENFDLPSSIDHESFIQDLKKLKNGEDIIIEEYNFNHRDTPPNQIQILSRPVIIVEGIFTFHFKQINELLDLKIFVDAPDYLMLKRRILRDGNERGYDLSDVLYRFEHHVMPAYTKYISPSKKEADIIVPNLDKFDNALEVLSIYLKQILK
ncbi:MAG: uridine kinase [Cyclobacteriaceae bacterium]|jgi:uridine kinase